MVRISRRWVAVLIFILALGVRVGALAARHEYVAPARVGAEAGAVASSVAAGRGFMSPFDGGVSASTHLPPLYPVLLAGLIKMQWSLGLAPADEPERAGAFVFYAALLINLLASAFLPLLALRIAEAARFPLGVGRLAAVMLCFCPEAMRAVGLVWDEALFATLCAGWLLLALRDAGRTLGWWQPVKEGLAAGLLSLLNPAFVPASIVAWAALNWPGRRDDATTEAQRHGGRTEDEEKKEVNSAGSARPVVHGISRSRFVGAMALFVGAILLAEMPWHVRNWVLLDPPARVFVRGNFWLECWTNLNPLKAVEGPGGTRWVAVHPWQGTDPLVRNGHELTEQEYFAWCRERVLASGEYSDPVKFSLHVMRDIVDFWTGYYEAERWHKSVTLFLLAQGLPVVLAGVGLVLGRGRMQGRLWWAIVGILAVFGLPYYVSGAAARYRHPIDLVIYLMAAWGVWCLAEAAGRRRVV